MVAARKAVPAKAADWKRVLIIVLCALTLASMLFLVQLNAVDRKTDEALHLTGLDFLTGSTPGKSAGVPHPMMIAAIVFAAWGVATAIFMPDKFVYSIISAIFLAVAVFMLRFDVTYQAKDLQN